MTIENYEDYAHVMKNVSGQKILYLKINDNHN